jgi:DNA-directed RNA polymerase specialized sigma24 family protein
MLTKKQIEQYTKLKQEISMLEDQISGAKNAGEYVTDVVRGSTKEIPYAMHNIVIKGYTSSHVPRLIKRKAAREKECREIERFVESIEDSVLRQLFTWRYIEGRTTTEAAQLVGYSKRQAIRLVNAHFEKMSPDVT